MSAGNTDPDGPGFEPRPPLVIVGPTAAGKSATALELARSRPPGAPAIEIVSCDSMQVYRGMDVGTATPTAAERAEVRHHLLDVVDPSESFDVTRFRELVDGALAGIGSRGSEAVLVGGTGLYVSAVVDDLRPPGRFPEVVASLEELGTEELTRRLEELDPLGASRVPPGNRRRLLRALEVTIGSGRPFSSYGPGLDAYPPTRFAIAGLAVPRGELARRIERRLRRQVADGFVEEVAELRRTHPQLSRTAAVALGYREIAEHLDGRCSLEEAIETTVRRTRRFAVRQERWFRRDPRVRWFDAPRDPDRSPADVAAEVDAWWSQTARECAAPTATVAAEAAAEPSDPGSAREPTCCD